MTQNFIPMKYLFGVSGETIVPPSLYDNYFKFKSNQYTTAYHHITNYLKLKFPRYINFMNIFLKS